MSYIEPNSEIRFLGKVNLRPKQEDTYYFSDIHEQTNFFLNKTVFARTAQSYTRVNGSKIRVEVTMAEAYQVNYIMFKNTSFENKWFYAFITADPKYISNTVTEFIFSIDVMQTWMFDYSLKPCFVERNHPVYDTFGTNFEEEGLSVGYLHETSIQNDFGKHQLGCIISAKPLPTIISGVVVTPINVFSVRLNSASVSVYPLFGTQMNITGKPFAGSATTLYIYPNIPITDSDAQYLIPRIDNYNLYSPSYALDCFGHVTTEYITISKILEVINYKPIGIGTLQGDLISAFFEKLQAQIEFPIETVITSTIEGAVQFFTGNKFVSNFIPSDIVAVYQYPAEFALKNWEQYAESLFSHTKGLSVSDIKSIESPSSFGTYTPNNKKLFQFPYNFVEVCDNEGTKKEYQYELSDIDDPFNDLKRIDYRYICQKGYPVSCTFLPYHYHGREMQYTDSLTLSSYITCAYFNNTYSEWLRQNTDSNTMRFLRDAVSIGLTAMGSPNWQALMSANDVKSFVHNENAFLQNSHFKGNVKHVRQRYHLDDKGRRVATPLSEVKPRDMFRLVNEGTNRVYSDPKEPNWTETDSHTTREEGSDYTRFGYSTIGASDTLFGMASSLSGISDGQAIANNSIAPINNSLMNTAIGIKQLSIKKMQISEEYAKRIDKYFDMYGYAINKVSVPTTHSRKYWTFVKTRNCKLNLINSIPMSDIDEITEIYNSGIAFWTRAESSDIGDYQYTNTALLNPERTLTSVLLYYGAHESMPVDYPFSPDRYTYNGTCASYSEGLVIQTNIAVDIELNGAIMPYSNLLGGYIGSMLNGTNTIHINSNNLTYTYIVNYTKLSVPFSFRLCAEPTGAFPYNITPTPSEQITSYTCSITSTSNIAYLFLEGADIVSVFYNGDSVYSSGGYYVLNLVSGTSTLDILYNNIHYITTITYSSGTVGSVTMSLWADEARTTPIEFSPAFSQNVTEYDWTAYINQDNRVWVEISPAYPINTVTCNGVVISGENGIYQVNLVADVNNVISVVFNAREYRFTGFYYPS